jgi:hypothetical protein
MVIFIVLQRHLPDREVSTTPSNVILSRASQDSAQDVYKIALRRTIRSTRLLNPLRCLGLGLIELAGANDVTN